MLEPNTVFSIFTASYNRAHTLPTLFQSLLKQDFKDFEWVIVDDGSTDSTQSVVKEFIELANFPITLLTQKHGGKMLAHNVAMDHCHGTFFLNVDSDDYLFPYTLSRLNILWSEIKQEDREGFGGISALSVNPDGSVIGEDYNQDITDASYDVMYESGHMQGDRLELWLTKILKQFPYPVCEGEFFVPDGLIFHQISRHYKVRFVNEALQTVVYQLDGISKNSIAYRAQNPKGMMLYYQDMVDHLHSQRIRLRCTANMFRYYYHQNYKEPLTNRSHFHAVVTGLLKVIGWVLYRRDKIYISLHSSG